MNEQSGKSSGGETEINSSNCKINSDGEEEISKENICMKNNHMTYEKDSPHHIYNQNNEHIKMDELNEQNGLNVRTEKDDNFRKRSDAISHKIGERLLKGWTLLADVCPACNEVPLMRDREMNCYCCGCDVTLGKPQAPQTSNEEEYPKTRKKTKPQQKCQTLPSNKERAEDRVQSAPTFAMGGDVVREYSSCDSSNDKPSTLKKEENKRGEISPERKKLQEKQEYVYCDAKMKLLTQIETYTSMLSAATSERQEYWQTFERERKLDCKSKMNEKPEGLSESELGRDKAVMDGIRDALKLLKELESCLNPHSVEN